MTLWLIIMIFKFWAADTLLKGDWDYKGFPGSIASNSDGGDRECIVMCSFGTESEKKRVQNERQRLADSIKFSNGIRVEPSTVDERIERLLKDCHARGYEWVFLLNNFFKRKFKYGHLWQSLEGRWWSSKFLRQVSRK